MNGTKTTSGLATTSLVLGILSPFCCGALTGIPAVICGHIARGKIKRDPSLKGDGLAVAGLVLGYLSIVLTIVVLLVSAPLAQQFQGFGQSAAALEKATKLQEAMQNAQAYPADTGVANVSQLREQLIQGGHLTAEEAGELDLELLQIGNVSKDDPAGTILIRSRQPGPFGIIMFLPKEGVLEAVMPEDATAREPQRAPVYLGED